MHRPATPENTGRTADVEAVTALFKTLTDSWAAADAEAYAGTFTPDADYVTFIGTHLSGRKQIADSHTALWAKFQKDTRLGGRGIRRIRFLTGDVAVLVTEGVVLRKGKSRYRPSEVKVQTLTAVRTPEGWRFASFHNTKRRPLMERISARFDPRIAPEVARSAGATR